MSATACTSCGRVMNKCAECGHVQRCDSGQGIQCMGNLGHDGPHWADMGRGDGGVSRWGLSGYGCGAHLDEARFCIREPGHELPHRDGRGTSWTPADDEELADA